MNTQSAMTWIWGSTGHDVWEGQARSKLEFASLIKNVVDAPCRNCDNSTRLKCEKGQYSVYLYHFLAM